MAEIVPPKLPVPSTPLVPPDRRVHAFRPDLACSTLVGRVAAERFVDGDPAEVVAPILAVHRAPDGASMRENEAITGDAVTVFDVADGWAWVQLARDGYVGYVRATGLGALGAECTHRVRALATFVYAEPDLKSPVRGQLFLNAKVRVIEQTGAYSALALGQGYVASRHLAEAGRFERDFVDVAERLIGTPYLWGGTTRQGIDCSGLVQTCMLAAGLKAPRDSDMQWQGLGDSHIDADAIMQVLSRDDDADVDGLTRGDLVCWRGHIGIMTDGVMMVHANAHHMTVAVEPMVVAARRIARDGGELLGVRLLQSLGA